ncbi:type I-E CRISPR-associated protein Cas6/Cse3/CasE [Streptomyces formicae]|uniref:Type I-E CRISPR-associated protein Cas6/Cse3/CasE n=1 Tax=Streptomyces formicae TaxID=1616117 RepID=A0ABY3WQT7_9ACTN|nr:type I-E CRISPR-associated protein Cas6/Cse3/CasE [Streptomyces formicae]UNM15016.1 type I-E CRISPR-associated protein Cas6/Cse3/CasE [Streptomyces formicae]
MTHHLTRFRFNTRRTGARRLLTSPQAMHAAVMSSFPHLLPGNPDTPRVLWRVDHTSAAVVHLYIVSPTPPDLTHLVEQAGWPAAEGPHWQTGDYSRLLDRLDKGTTWSFRLTANPVHYVRNEDGAPTKRTAHRVPKHQLAWLLERQERGGFSILIKPESQRLTEHGDEHLVIVRSPRPLSFTKSQDDRRHQVRVTAVTYDGHLEVTDPDRLRTLLTQGLGKARAYGCGLMTLAPIG